MTEHTNVGLNGKLGLFFDFGTDVSSNRVMRAVDETIPDQSGLTIHPSIVLSYMTTTSGPYFLKEKVRSVSGDGPMFLKNLATPLESSSGTSSSGDSLLNYGANVDWVRSHVDDTVFISGYTKEYVDFATTGDISSISTSGSTTTFTEAELDLASGYSSGDSMSILLWQQSDAAENGLYTLSITDTSAGESVTGNLARHRYLDTSARLFGGSYVVVRDGSAHGGQLAVCTTRTLDSSAVIGTDDNEWIVGTTAVGGGGSVSVDDVTIEFNGSSEVAMKGTPGTAAANQGLIFDGSVNIVNIGTMSAVEYASPSDIRLKTEINPINTAWDVVTNVQGYEFQWKNKERSEHPAIGLMAQEVAAVAPSLVQQVDSSGYLSVSYDKFVPYLVECVKSLRAEVDTLHREVALLKTQRQSSRPQSSRRASDFDIPKPKLYSI